MGQDMNLHQKVQLVLTPRLRSKVACSTQVQCCYPTVQS